MTPVPRRMFLVRSAAKAMKISGELMISKPGGVVLADPGLVEAELVEPLHQFEVAFEALGRVLLVRMERRQKDPVAEIGQ